MLEKAGLIIKSERMEHILIDLGIELCFQSSTINGNTIAFSGELLGEDEPKYLNSPETAIFNKSKILYNFHMARPSHSKNATCCPF